MRTREVGGELLLRCGMKYLISSRAYRVNGPVCDDGSGQADNHAYKAVEEGAEDGCLR